MRRFGRDSHACSEAIILQPFQTQNAPRRHIRVHADTIDTLAGNHTHHPTIGLKITHQKTWLAAELILQDIGCG